jgi:hypothetical protein
VKQSIPNRREFLKSAGAAATGAAAFPQLLASVPPPASGDPVSGITPAPKIRGVMVDAARLPERLEYYRHVVDFCAEWELTTLQFRLTDDQGSALRFASVPNLLTHAHAFTPDELRSLVDYASTNGVDIIPEVEAFGHTGYITRSPAYAHLLDNDPHGSAESTGIIPVHPDSLTLFEKLFREIAALFPSKLLHGGCDEVNWGGSELSRKALTTKTRAQIWAEYLNALNQIAQGLSKELIVWGDFVLHKEPQILSQLNKGIIVMDWNYWDTDAHQFRDALARVHANSSRAIGAPGLISYRWGPRAGTTQLRNIDAFADAYFSADHDGSMGAILTNWVPTRYIQNSLWDTFAYGAVAFKDGPPAAQDSALPRFIMHHYGATWNDAQNGIWSEAFQLLYNAAPSWGDNGAGSPMGIDLVVPYSNDEQLSKVLKARKLRPNPFTRIRSLFATAKPAVTRNHADFQAVALCVEYLEAMFWRENVIVEYMQSGPLKSSTARQLIQTIAGRDSELAAALEKDWDEGRFADSTGKMSPIFGFQLKDELLFQWKKAAAFTAGLASHPGQFEQLLRTTGLA